MKRKFRNHRHFHAILAILAIVGGMVLVGLSIYAIRYSTYRSSRAATLLEPYCRNGVYYSKSQIDGTEIPCGNAPWCGGLTYTDIENRNKNNMLWRSIGKCWDNGVGGVDRCSTFCRGYIPLCCYELEATKNPEACYWVERKYCHPSQCVGVKGGNCGDAIVTYCVNIDHCLASASQIPYIPLQQRVMNYIPPQQPTATPTSPPNSGEIPANQSATLVKTEFNNNPAQDNTDIHIGVEINSAVAAGEVTEIVQSFQGLPIFIKLVHPSSTIVQSQDFARLISAGFSIYASQSSYTALRAFADSFYQTYPAGSLYLELDSFSVLNKPESDTLVAAHPQVRLIAPDTSAGNYSGIQQIVNTVPFKPLHAVSYHYTPDPPGSTSDIYGTDFYTANATFFDTSDNSYKIKYPADPYPNENLMTALSHIDIGNNASDQAEALRWGLVAIAMYDYAQESGQHGIKYINVGPYMSFRANAKSIAQFVATLSARKMRIFWPNSSTGNGDPWQSGILDQSTKPVVGIAADSAADGVAYFFANGSGSAYRVELTFPQGVVPQSYTLVSSLSGVKTNVRFQQNQVNVNAFEVVGVSSKNINTSQPPTNTPIPGVPPTNTPIPGIPTNTPTPMLPAPGQGPLAALRAVSFGPFCTQRSVDINRTASSVKNDTLSYSHLFVSISDTSGNPTVWPNGCPASSSPAGSTGKWCIIDATENIGKDNFYKTSSWAFPSVADFIVMTNAQNTGNHFQCTGNPECDFNGGTLNCRALGWEDCGPNDSIHVQVENQCGATRTTYSKFTIERTLSNPSNCDAPGKAIDLTVKAQAEGGQILEKADVYVGKPDHSPWTEGCPQGTIPGSPYVEWCKVDSLNFSGNNTAFTRFTPDAQGTYVIVINGKEKDNTNMCTGNHACQFNGGTSACVGWFDCAPNSQNPSDIVRVTASNSCVNSQQPIVEQNFCSPLTSNGDSLTKHDVVIVPDGYTDPAAFKRDAEASVASVKNSNLGGLFNKLNFWIHTDLSQTYGVTKDCAKSASGCTWDVDKSLKAMRSCDADSVLVIANIPQDTKNKNAGMAIVGSNAALVFQYSTPAAVHELAHSIASVNDEYSYNTTNNNKIKIEFNCADVGPASQTRACPVWNAFQSSQAKCIAGCGYTNWFRSTSESLMGNYEQMETSHTFNDATLYMWDSALKKFQ